LHCVCVTYLRWGEQVFWDATYRKIYSIIAIYRQLNDPKAKKKNRPAPKLKGEKIGLQEALKRF